MRLAGFDVETYGVDPAYALQPFRQRTGEAWITAAVFKADGFRGLKALRSDTLLNKIRICLKWAAMNNITIVGWNTPYDCAILIGAGLRDEVFACKWLDAMLLYKHVEQHPTFESYRADIKGLSYSLKAAVRRYLPDRADYEKDIEFGTTDPVKLAQLLDYNEMDVDCTLDLAMLFWKQLNPDQRRAAIIEAASIPLVAEAMVEGIAGDSDAASELSDKLLEESNAAFCTLKLQNPEDITPEVLASPVQLRELVFEKWGLPYVTLTDKGAASTDREALTYLATIDERAKLLNTYREAKNNMTKFAGGMLEALYYNRDGFVRPQPRLYGTYTGRMTYSSTQGRGKSEVQTGVALHQWKRDPEFRKLIRAPEGYTLLEFDFAGQEYRWFAVEANDPTMIGLCQPGEDAHGYMAASIRGVDYRSLVERVKAGDKAAKNDRQLGKVANLCVTGDTLVLTDRGWCSIVQVTKADRVWDGMEFVTHDGVVCSGVRNVMTYSGVSATPDHKVLCNGEWVEIQEAARHGWTIEPALGTGWAGKARAAFRIMAGIVHRHACEVQRALRAGEMSLRYGAGSKSADDGSRAVDNVQGLRDAASASEAGTPHLGERCRPATTEAGERNAAALHKSQRPQLSQLWGAWDRVSIWLNRGVRGVHQAGAPTRDVPETGHRSSRQRGALRAWKSALGYAPAEPAQHTSEQVPVYDIVNCGPRHCFTANGVIVHNSLQYRTSAKRLQSVAAVQYGIKLLPAEAEVIHKTYQNTYTQVPKYWRQQKYKANTQGYIANKLGRRVAFLPKHSRDPAYEWSYTSTAINYPIQSMGAEQKLLALAVSKNILPEYDGRFYFELHDALMFVIPTSKARAAYERFKHVLSNLPYKRAWGLDLPIQFPVDGKLGPSWGELRGVDDVS